MEEDEQLKLIATSRDPPKELSATRLSYSLGFVQKKSSTYMTKTKFCVEFMCAISLTYSD